MPERNLTGIVLAGGRSLRMGCDKARLPWGRTTLLDHVIETIRPLVDEVLVVVKETARVGPLNARVVEDLVDAHALGGLYTGLRLASSEWCFVCACDAPFLNAPLIRCLVEQADGYEVVIPKTRQGLEPLHAVYATLALPAIEAQLRSRRWDLHALVGRLRANVLEPEVVARYDPSGLSGLNLNTPREYARACRMRLTQVIDRVSCAPYTATDAGGD